MFYKRTLYCFIIKHFLSLSHNQKINNEYETVTKTNRSKDSRTS